MRLVFLIFCVCTVIIVQAQFPSYYSKDSLPSPNLLFAAVDSFYNQSLAAELKAFESNPKDYWMNFVPSVGIAYTPSGAPRPSVSFSLNSLLQSRKQKQQIAAIRESIILKNHIERQKAKSKDSKIYHQIKILKEDLIFSNQVFEIEKQLFEFYQKQDQNHDIKPSEFLIKKIAFLKKEETIRIQKRQIDNLTLELYEALQL